MRITGGEFAGRVIKGSPGSHVRPTTDRARESFFNILQNRYDFAQTKVLDLFAGTGVMALEFISRGCVDVVSVDLNPKSIQFMKQLKLEFGVADNWSLKKENALNFVQIHDLQSYDVIYADPPYHWTFYQELLNQIMKKVASPTLVCLEHERNHLLPHITLVEEKFYGQSTISFYRK